MEDLIAHILAMLFSVFILLAIVAFGKWRELSKERKQRSLVAWSAAGGGGLSLWSEISNAQHSLKLSSEYCLAGDDEWACVREIIEEYRKDLMHSYFKGHLIVIKSKYDMSGEDYFIATLYAFLSDHQCDYEFLGHDMHKEQISYKRYGESFSAGSDATYALTDFAVVLHKMHYITYMYCRSNDILKSFVPEWNEKNLKEIVETKQIQISRW